VDYLLSEMLLDVLSATLTLGLFQGWLHTTIGTAEYATSAKADCAHTAALTVLLTGRRRIRECKGLRRMNLLRWQKQIEEQILWCGR
jgi:hypothetical protein